MYYKVINTEHKGRCVIANDNIPPHTIILRELPFIVAEDVYDALYVLFSGDSDEETLEAFNKLAPSKIDKNVHKYNDLVADMKSLPEYIRDFFMNWKPDRLRLMVAKFQRNAFNYTSPPCAILNKGTLFNHSCDNNVDFHINSKGEFIFETNRNIKVGEELCDKYIDTNISVKKRLKTLYEQYGFICRCDKCT